MTDNVIQDAFAHLRGLTDPRGHDMLAALERLVLSQRMVVEHVEENLLPDRRNTAHVWAAPIDDRWWLRNEGSLRA